MINQRAILTSDISSDSSHHDSVSRRKFSAAHINIHTKLGEAFGTVVVGDTGPQPPKTFHHLFPSNKNAEE